MMKSRTLFISDLHLCETQPETAEAFLSFLKNQAKEADTLYILGDFFEAWIGDDDQTAFNTKIIQALRKFTDMGTPTFFMHGNRDFLIGKRFAKETGVQLLKEPTRIELYNKPVLLLHGDSLCTLDTKHQKARKLMHNRFYQKLTRLIPLRVRKQIANRMRATSRNNKNNLAANLMDVTPEEVVRVMREYNVTTLIHGHTHRPDIHKFSLNDQTAQRFVLGAWHPQGRYLQVDEDGAYSLQLTS